MTRRERVISALNHRETDFVPYHIGYTGLERERLEKALGKDFDHDWQYHMYGYDYCGWPENISTKNKDFFRDDYGVVWNRSGADKDIGMIDKLVIEDIEDCNYVFPTIDASRLRKEIAEHLKYKEDKFTVIGIGFSVFERAWSLAGMENTLASMLTAPEQLENLLQNICNYNKSIMDIMLEFDFDAFYFGDDWGAQKGLMMGKQLWVRFLKPIMKELYQKAKSAGRYVIQHSCGDCSEIFPDLIEIGLDCYQTFQPEIYNISEIKRLYGDKLTFWGGISTQQLLASATPEEVKRKSLEILNIMKHGGGYIFAPTHAVPHDVPPENIVALYEVMKNQG